jgi:predicted nucleic acid-binding protein
MVERVFLDANVWFSAARSRTGGSFLIMEFAQHGLVQICINQHVLDEAERNLLLKSPHSVDAFHLFFSAIKPIFVAEKLAEATRKQLGEIMPQEDIPVVAGALSGKVRYLITLDKRHIANVRMRLLPWPFKIVLPGEFLELFQKDVSP